MVAKYEDDHLWDVMPCSLTKTDQRFGPPTSMRLQGVTFQKKNISKTPKNLLKYHVTPYLRIMLQITQLRCTA
jgi:hypothetical protein